MRLMGQTMPYRKKHLLSFATLENMGSAFVFLFVDLKKAYFTENSHLLL